MVLAGKDIPIKLAQFSKSLSLEYGVNNDCLSSPNLKTTQPVMALRSKNVSTPLAMSM